MNKALRDFQFPKSKLQNIYKFHKEFVEKAEKQRNKDLEIQRMYDKSFKRNTL